jgi:hypothetical protein
MEQVWNILLPVLGTLLTALVSIALAYMNKKLGLEVAEKKEDKLRSLVREGVLGAEEWAFGIKKRSDSGVAPDHHAKFDYAVKSVEDLMRMNGDKRELPSRLIRSLISQEISKLPGLGASG